MAASSAYGPLAASNTRPAAAILFSQMLSGSLVAVPERPVSEEGRDQVGATRGGEGRAAPMPPRAAPEG